VVLFPAEQEAGAADGVERDDVPGIFGDDVGGDEVDFAGEVGNGAASAAVVGVDAVEAVEELGGTFDLDAIERRWTLGGERAGKGCGPIRPGRSTAGGGRRHMGIGARHKVAGVEDEVVAFAVAVGFGDAEAKAGGDEEEDEFGELAATLGVAITAEGMDWRDSSWARRWRAPARRPDPGHAKMKRRKPWGLRL